MVVALGVFAGSASAATKDGVSVNIAGVSQDYSNGWLTIKVKLKIKDRPDKHTTVYYTVCPKGMDWLDRLISCKQGSHYDGGEEIVTFSCKVSEDQKEMQCNAAYFDVEITGVDIHQ